MNNEVEERVVELVDFKMNSGSVTIRCKKLKPGTVIDNTDNSSLYESNMKRMNISKDGSVSYN